ncbi:helix-turn-helix transcriptional regulator [Methylobacterium sp. WSM2598]|uniref:helix-turn-helix transcriptional regulator n=1 Tax=Methylobacterium sp. WSM2598 TaxID=398261 RepID=UPI0003A40F40|nr:helix-turn-helix transcriptional regulator [Methylobacterium sp. WSM2598]
MRDLILSIKRNATAATPRPFSVYTSLKEQRILNAPISKPLLICVMAGVKKLGKADDIVCPAQNFLFLPNTTKIDMRNIPSEEYLALLIEFEYAGFAQFKESPPQEPTLVQGEIGCTLAKTLQQYIEWSAFAQPELWHFRRQEILQLLYLSGHRQVGGLAARRSLSHRIHDIVSEDVAGQWTVERLAARLAVGPTTLRRRIRAEDTGIRSVVERTRLGHGLHLVQTTMEPIGRIAERCGYLSQSRFTHRFKRLFGVTPSELRRTRLP